jgi:dipeptidyl aminopeptidase/acylaminoacyl peptidase
MCAFCSCITASFAQNIPKPDPLTAKGIPALPLGIAEEVKPYTESRSAGFVSWHPVRKEMLITTRFGNTNQLHQVLQPGGDRRQISFFDEPLSNASFEPTKGDYFIFSKDIGGNEFRQLYSFNLITKKTVLLTDGGKTQNSQPFWNKAGTKILYTCTLRNGKDRDIYQMNPLMPGSGIKIAELAGSGWTVADWSDDERFILLNQYISVNESAIWLYDMQLSVLKKVMPDTTERTIYQALSFCGAKYDEMYILSNKDGEYTIPYILETKTHICIPLLPGIQYEVEQFEINDQQTLAVSVTNESGISKCYLQDLNTKIWSAITTPQNGIISSVNFHHSLPLIGFSFGSALTPSDVFVFDIQQEQLTRWTESETGSMSLAGLTLPELITWRSFDQLPISGFLYRANSRFTGRRPVIIQIHGGPEGQSRPGFIGRSNYYLNELGVSIIYPNVRGSTGFGKTFTDLDNGLKREESVKDIGGLLDWIAKQPDLDPERVMITGGSYGGYMTLACAVHYTDRIRCALDVVGISHFTTFLKNTEAYRRDLRRVEYGDERDSMMADFFEKIAPLNHTDRITKPLFIVQGRNDPRVPFTEAIQMMNKITEKGGIVWYLEAADEGHGFQKKANIDYQFYSTVQFVKQYLLND